MSRFEGIKFALDPSPRQKRLLASNAGGARFAYNAMLNHVIEQLEYNKKVADEAAVELDWSHYDLRRWWNKNKYTLAPWWSSNSSNVYGYAAECLGKGLKNYSDSRKGIRRGRRVGFPKFKSRRSSNKFAYTSGFKQPMWWDTNALVLPKIGRVHCMENVFDRVSNGRVLRITVSEKSWALVCFINGGVS